MRKALIVGLIGCALLPRSLHAADLAISIGIRETQAVSGTIFADGGTSGGIEFINQDGQTLTVDGTWQLFTFTPETDPLLAFAGTTANSILEGDWGVLDHIRIRNIDGITDPVTVFIDDVTNTVSGGPTVEGFEGFAVGSEVMFREPGFSGSTISNLITPPNSASVIDSMAFDGSQSYALSFQFVDNDSTRWVRVMTFQTPNLPNPTVRLQEVGFNPTISFYAKAVLGLLDGEECADGEDCVSGNCVDDVCCAEASCPQGQSCNNPGAEGMCSSLDIPNGDPCTDPGDCLSGNCVDDVCCAQESCSEGESCNNPGTAGECSSDPTAAAPGLSPFGLLLAVCVLSAVAALGLLRQRREGIGAR
jgi:hypothetical protein